MNRNKYRDFLDDIEDFFGERRLQLTVTDVAKLTNRHYMTIWNACARGELPASQERKGCQYRINYRDLYNYLYMRAAA